MKVESNRAQHVFEVLVYLNDLDPDAARVELYADGVNGDGPVRQEMERVRELTGASKGYGYRTQVSATRPAVDYTPRVIPQFNGAAIPLEATRIRWRG
jgi:glycogen phosphorylase